jgi:prepilin-type N-terminal cleavage/methylation domain-containing protein
MHTHQNLTTPHYRSRGFSMVELMVALVITLILLAGIGQIFLGSKKSFVIQNALARIQENGRYAMEVLASDLRRAGYWGGNADITSIIGTQGINPAVTEACNTTGGTSDWTRMLGRPIYGLDLSGSQKPSDTGNDYSCIQDAGATPYVRGDVLLVRYAHPSAIGSITKPLSCPAGTTIAACYPNEFFLRSSLFRGRLFKGSESGEVQNDLAAPAIRTAELVAHAYYIGNSSTASACPADGNVPSLFRVGLNSDTGGFSVEEVAYGVDNLQVKYGIGLDTDGDDINDSFRYFDGDEIDSTDATKPDWEDVVAARVWLLVRAECPETGYTNDNTYAMSENYTPADTPGRGYRRKLYTSIINLRNNL